MVKNNLLFIIEKEVKIVGTIARLLMTRKSTVADIIKRYREEDRIEFKKQKRK